MRRSRRYALGFAGLASLLLVLTALNVVLGSSSVTASEALRLLFPGGADVDTTAYHVIWDIRLPRLCAAALLGGMLSVTGFCLQTFFANPIAGPYVLGISSGAKLVVALTLVWSLVQGVALDSAALIVAAFIGALLAMGFVLVIAGRVRNAATLIVCGVMIGYVCSAVTDIVVAFADDANIVNLHTWSQGSFSGISWDNVAVIAIVAVAALAWSVALSKPMGAYQLGESYAANAGVNIKSFRTQLVLLSSLLAATVTAFAGPVSFVGIAVPQLVKGLFGTARPLIVVPGAFLGGAAFCLFCDLVARTAFAPTELGISTVTAIFGAPVVMWMLVSRRRGRRTHGE